MLLRDPIKTENKFNKLFIKSYLFYCSIISLMVLTSFFFFQFNTNELINLQEKITPSLGWFYLSTIIFSLGSLFYFRFITPNWIFQYADKKFYLDVFVFILLIISYIPATILTYSYLFSTFHNIVLYGSYIAILLQLPNFLAGSISMIMSGDYASAMMIVGFAMTRLISPILLFFSYPSRKSNNTEQPIVLNKA